MIFSTALSAEVFRRELALPAE